MHGNKKAGADKESSQQAHGEGEDAKQRDPGFQGAAAFQDDIGMEQRRACKPGQQRGVFYRIPKPKSAPAQFTISPPTSKADTEGEKAPGKQYPALGELGPLPVHAL